ncbi:hypothetical protein [Brevundimonas sp.]|uniref:hypothetical protein n=1 Tax=Brevundimonas sp. TaxID=1871086 RepID=UPI003564E3B0
MDIEADSAAQTSFDVSDRDYAHMLLGDIDLDAQLLAIRSAIRRNAEADALLSQEIAELGERAKAASHDLSWRLTDIWVDRNHASVYQDAAHSMAAVGMIAPLVEALLVRVFRAIGEQNWPLASDKRERRCGNDARFWNPQIYYDKNDAPKTNLLAGTMQLFEASGLKVELKPPRFASTSDLLETLIAYRNNLFHNGFEWPVEQRAAFDALIEKKAWPQSWFPRSTSGGATWIVYMGEDFIDLCLEWIDELLESAGRLARKQGTAHGWKTGD